MQRLGVTLIVPLLALTSCATTGPAIYSDSTTVSHADIQTAVELVQKRCVREGRGLLPVFRVDVDRFDEIFVHCGAHYGVADAAGALTFFVERRQGTWQITGMSRYTPNPERVIVT
jgi:hypothetical protein